MSATTLNLISKVRTVKARKLPTVTRETVAHMGAVEQMKRAFSAGNRLSAAMGIVLGGFVPVAVYALVHFEAQARPWMWSMILGGLAYSAISVYKWAESAFHLRVKAVGFVVLLEGVTTFSGERWLSCAGLALLVVINGVSAAVALQAKEAI